MDDARYYLSADHDPTDSEPLWVICRRIVNGVQREAVFRERNHGWVNIPPDRRDQAGIAGLETVEASEEQTYQAIAARLNWLASHGEDFTYYLKVNEPRGRSRPGGVLRRYKVDGWPHDEVYRFGGLGWWPTEFFDLYRLGHDDHEYIEVPAEEAKWVIAEIRRRSATAA